MVPLPPGPPNAARPGGFQPPPPPPPPGRSGAVTAVAIVNFVLGGLKVLGGVLVLFCGAAVVAMLGGVASQSGSPTETGTATAVVGVLVTVAAIVVMITGVPMLAAGFGVHKRTQWGRILTLVLGGLSGIFALFSLLSFNIVGIVIEGGYCAMAFTILLNPEYAAEFH